MCEEFSVLKTKVIVGDREGSVEETKRLIGDGVEASRVLELGLMSAMATVGERMRAEEMFIPEVLLSAQVTQVCVEVLKPHLSASAAKYKATIVIGTVEGDVHDIGKNIVAMMLEGAGYEVIDLGAGVTKSQFAEEVRQRGADVLAMSALLTTTMPHMRETVAHLEKTGLRSQVKVIVGGAPLTPQYARDIGADGWAGDAVTAIERVQELVGVMS